MPTARRRDWRDAARDATDLALLGIAVSIAALPLLTAPAAVAAGSAAVHDRLATGDWPAPGRTLRRVGPGGRAGLPGAPRAPAPRPRRAGGPARPCAGRGARGGTGPGRAGRG